MDLIGIVCKTEPETLVKTIKKIMIKPNTTQHYLQSILMKHRAGYFVLVDPDQHTVSSCARLGELAEESGVDAILLGGSFLTVDLDPIAKSLKKATSLPIILFPGSALQLSQNADAILYLSLISGRNPHYLIGEQVRAAPLVRDIGLDTIPTGYMLIEGGTSTSVSFMSGSAPIPRDKLDIAWAHALAAEYMGMDLIYLEAGSGAELAVPSEMISEIKGILEIPVIVGGGIRTPSIAIEKVKAGADFIVTGSIIESDPSLMKAFSDAIHWGIEENDL